MSHRDIPSYVHIVTERKTSRKCRKVIFPYLPELEGVVGVLGVSMEESREPGDKENMVTMETVTMATGLGCKVAVQAK